MAVLFVDIEGCTQLCEDLPPKEMHDLIESFFSSFFDVVKKAGGTVDNIMGDGFMAIVDGSGNRQSIPSAAQAALNIQSQAQKLNARRSKQFEPVLVNIGINAGSAYVGMTRLPGISGGRSKHTAIGPAVNVAARLCALATGGSIFVSAEVAEHLKGDCYSLRPLGPTKLKNVSRRVVVFELDNVQR